MNISNDTKKLLDALLIAQESGRVDAPVIAAARRSILSAIDYVEFLEEAATRFRAMARTILIAMAIQCVAFFVCIYILISSSKVV